MIQLAFVTVINDLDDVLKTNFVNAENNCIIFFSTKLL